MKNRNAKKAMVSIYDAVENRHVKVQKWAADLKLKAYHLSKPGGRYCLSSEMNRHVATPPPPPPPPGQSDDDSDDESGPKGSAVIYDENSSEHAEIEISGKQSHPARKQPASRRT